MFGKLDNFWMRHNRTRIDCVCLNEEKSSLQKQNKGLKLKLKSYLITVNMTSGQPKDEKFLSRPSSMKIEKIVHIELKSDALKKSKLRRPVTAVTCVEGNLSNVIRHMNITKNINNLRTEPFVITNN